MKKHGKFVNESYVLRTLSYTDRLFNLLIVYVLPFVIYRSLLLGGSGWLSLYTANDICPSGEVLSILPIWIPRNLFAEPGTDLSNYFFYTVFQKEYSLFLSVDEYQIPEIRNGLFHQYLQQYLEYSEKKVLNDGDEKVSTSAYDEAVKRKKKILDVAFDQCKDWFWFSGTLSRCLGCWRVEIQWRSSIFHFMLR